MSLDPRDTRDFVDSLWDESIIPVLKEYIAVPALSPLFDPGWEANGHIEKAMDLIETWCRDRPIQGLSVERIHLGGRTPLLWMEIPGTTGDTVLLYGHMDKQPEMTGWRDDLGPWKPVIEDGKLYGRGGADDGYAAFASLAAVEALQRAGVPHARYVVLIEGSEESGSPDLPAYMDHLRERIGIPDFIVCLDSGAGDYERLWTTTSLRGIVVGTLTVSVLSEGVHSGSASGIVPSSFRIARHLLNRIEDETTGEIRVREFFAEIPEARRKQARDMGQVLGERIYRDYPFLPGMKPVADHLTELVLNNTWRPMLSIVGAAGLPALATAGNVLRPTTSLKLSLRLPPRVDAEAAAGALKEILEADPPYGAAVSFEIEGPGSGWDAPALAPWLEEALEEASRRYFDHPACAMGEGGSIPFMSMLGERYPEAQFLITGVLGPQSNAHGPNEFLHIPTGKRLTACVADVLARHGAREGRS